MKVLKLLAIIIFVFALLILFFALSQFVEKKTLHASINRKWHLTVLPESMYKEPFELSVTVDSLTEDEGLEVYYQIINSSISGQLYSLDLKNFAAMIDISSLSPGEYSVYAFIVSEDEQTKSNEMSFYVSEPVSVSWTMDWEGWDVPEAHLISIEQQFKDHKDTPVTHFFNPRIFLPSVMEATQSAHLTDWVKNRAEKNGDEIQLHIHMHLDLVQAAGLVPITEPKWGYLMEEPGAGYDVFTTEYSYAEFSQILVWAKDQFRQNNLPRPTGYRAAGWFADLEILEALQDNGFKYDASGRERDIWDQEDYFSPWDLNSTTQPYYPSRSDQNKTNIKHFDLLEIPNNGGDCYGYTNEELIDRFFDNFNKGPVREKKAITYISHLQWQDHDQPIIEKVLDTTDKYLYKYDQGPVIYTTLSQVYELWK